MAHVTIGLEIPTTYGHVFRRRRVTPRPPWSHSLGMPAKVIDWPTSMGEMPSDLLNWVLENEEDAVGVLVDGYVYTDDTFFYLNLLKSRRRYWIVYSRPPFWKFKTRFLDYHHAVKYADAYPRAPRYDPSIRINWLRKEEWNNIRRSLHPAVEYDDLLWENVIKRMREDEEEKRCCCGGPSRLPLAPPPSYSETLSAAGSRKVVEEERRSTDRAKGRLFRKKLALLSEWP